MKKQWMAALLTVAMSAGMIMTAGAADAKYCFYFPMPHAFGNEVNGYAVEFAEEQGIELYTMFGSAFEQSDEDTNMRALAADGYNAFMAMPATDGASGLFQELGDFDVDVVTFGAATSGQGELFCVATDVETAAYEACEDVIEALGGKGGILNVLEVLNDTNTIKRQAGVNACIEAHDGVELVQEVADIDSIDEGVEKISSALAANEGKVNGMVCTGNQASSAAVQVLNDYYDRNPDAEKIVLVTIDTPEDVMAGIESGVVYGTIAQNTRAMGSVPLVILQMLADGYEKIEGTYFIDSGCTLVTKENVETFPDDLAVITQNIIDSLDGTYLTK